MIKTKGSPGINMGFSHHQNSKLFVLSFLNYSYMQMYQFINSPYKYTDGQRTKPDPSN